MAHRLLLNLDALGARYAPNGITANEASVDDNIPTRTLEACYPSISIAGTADEI